MDEGDGFENEQDPPPKCLAPNDIQRNHAGGEPISSALGTENAAVAGLFESLDPDLVRVVHVWPSLADEVKAAVLALVAAHEAMVAGRVGQ